MSERQMVVVAGKLGAGKDTAAAYLEGKGFYHVSAGDVLRRKAQEAEVEPPFSREFLQRINDELDAQHPEGPITAEAQARYESVRQEYPAGLVISGLRRMREIRSAKKRGAKVLFLDAPVELCYKRVADRMRGDDLSLEVFVARQKDELEGTTELGKEGIWLNGVREAADNIIVNDGTVDDLYAKLDAVLGLQN